MKKYLLILMALSLFLASCTTTKVTNFEECVAAGNAVMESYPRQCNADGETFVEEIEVELDDVNQGSSEEGTETVVEEDMPVPGENTPETQVVEESGITESDLAMHDMATDCWIAFEGSVYDITDYLPRHEGGANEIIPYCGTSTEFEDAFIGEHEREQVSKLVKEGLYQGELIN